jgi:hypothetical protein
MKAKAWLVGAFVWAGICSGLSPKCVGALPENNANGGSGITQSVPPLILSGRSEADRKEQKISTSVGEVLKLLDAKISPSVIKAFIKTAPMPYQPTAAELITLNEHGAEADVLVELLQRSAELMARSAQPLPIAQFQMPPVAVRYVPEVETQTPEPAVASDSTSAADYSDPSYGASVVVGGPGFPYAPPPRGGPGGRPHPPRPGGGWNQGGPGERPAGPPPVVQGRPPGVSAPPGQHAQRAAPPSGGHGNGAVGGRSR